MRLEWTDREVVFIADVGTVGPGTEFEIEDSRGQDLLNRGCAKLVEKPLVQNNEAEEMDDKRDIHVVVTDGFGAGDY
jgi:hypothetical protein